jgi:hypothetical protein
VPEIIKLFHDILFTDKNYNEQEIFTKFEDIVNEVNRESLDIGIGVLVDFKNEGKDSEKYPLIIRALGIIEHLERKFDSRSNSEKIDAFQSFCFRFK